MTSDEEKQHSLAAEAFSQTMGDAAEALSQVWGCDLRTATLALVAIWEEYARAAGYTDMKEAVRSRSIEQVREDTNAFRDALIKKALPEPPKRHLWRRRPRP